ncbi:MAG TPA: alkaline phosphatase family protein [Bacteroidales bacterium]|nr:alkaline phosphatase family protein [Bacteroidales bacterium]
MTAASAHHAGWLRLGCVILSNQPVKWEKPCHRQGFSYLRFAFGSMPVKFTHHASRVTNTMSKASIFAILLSLLTACSPGTKVTRAPESYVVVLSMDGFRWDYPDRYYTPNLDKMARTGVKAASLQPSYPTKTFPNHYSIATGLYPDHHGIVQNSFYDPKLDRVFRMGVRSAVEDSIFWEGEAIWETAEMQGVKTASYFWVGSESNETYRPGFRKFYEDGFSYVQQIDTVMHWLSLPITQRPRLVMFYFNEPDGVGHNSGPESQETKKVVEELDQLVGMISARLKGVEKKEKIRINFIIVSDHGMGFIPEGNQVFLDEVIDLKRVRRINGGNPVFILEPDSGYLEEAYRLLSTTRHIRVWEKGKLPDHYHYGTHQRIPALIVEADSAWGVEIRRRAKGEGIKIEYTRGTHGYDPVNKDMHGIFYATGPVFKQGFIQPTFENVAIYGLLARILGINPTKTDGNFMTINGVLKGY